MKKIMIVCVLLVLAVAMIPGVMAGGDQNTNVHCDENAGETGTGDAATNINNNEGQMPEFQPQERPGYAQL
ncbi:hypothetical protein GOV10_02350 [Candidatus Woesearchaeota archaeon]|nr:hypothetical protein [Candidatus Woesearchaeota archaeon]